jgi:TPR repeat protein
MDAAQRRAACARAGGGCSGASLIHVGHSRFTGESRKSNDFRSVSKRCNARLSPQSSTPPGFHPLQLKRHGIHTQNRHRRSETGPSAEQGNAFGQNSFGGCLENGFGVGKDLNRAVEFHRLPVEQGNAFD